MGHVVSVNVGAVRTVEWHGRQVDTGIWKAPVDGRVALHGINLEGDRQADLRVHGGADKAVYAYAIDDYAWWSEELGRTVGPGTFGENLTVTGAQLDDAVIGTRWRVGSTVLEISQPRLPCFKLGIRMGDTEFVDRFEAAERFGAYLRIIDEGDIGAGDVIEVSRERTDDGISVRQLAVGHVRSDAAWFRRVMVDPDVPESWKDWAARGLARAGAG